MKKILHVVERGEQNKDAANYVFWCPGCDCGHGVWTDHPNGITGATWQFNGNMEKPTFTPSIRVQGPKPMCHLNVTEGMLYFHGDSEHKLAGQTVPMVAF